VAAAAEIHVPREAVVIALRISMRGQAGGVALVSAAVKLSR
jgi:hypothetical protein